MGDLGKRVVVDAGGQVTGEEEYPAFSISELGECGEGNFGYVVNEGAKVEPCIFIKLNTIWGWKPEPYDCDGSDEKVCEHINKQGDDAKNNIYINCAGRYAADQEALEGDGLKYFPESQALPIKYFPYEGQERREQLPFTAGGCEDQSQGAARGPAHPH